MLEGDWRNKYDVCHRISRVGSDGGSFVMASEGMSDEEIVRTLPVEILALLSAEQRAAFDRILARLTAAEKVCRLVGGNLKPKRRTVEKGKRVYWWDVAIAVEEWEELVKT
jgi:hypothetical protein